MDFIDLPWAYHHCCDCDRLLYLKEVAVGLRPECVCVCVCVCVRVRACVRACVPVPISAVQEICKHGATTPLYEFLWIWTLEIDYI